MPSPSPLIYWFRSDLRLDDNPALQAAMQRREPVLPVYVLDDSGRPMGSAARWWLHHSLASLRRSLERRGGGLLLLRGEAATVLRKLAGEVSASGLWCAGQLTAGGLEQERRLREALPGFRVFPPSLLFGPDWPRTQGGRPYQVFTPFWRSCQMAPPVAPCGSLSLGANQFFRWSPGSGRLEERLDDWGLRPCRPDWATGLRENWRPGATAAAGNLRQFLKDGLRDYESRRDRMDCSGSSRLSPHLCFGELSPARLWHEAASASMGQAGTAWRRQLVWREFCWQLLRHWPALAEQPFRREFSSFPWRDGEEAEQDLRAWQQGRTGYPVVDAGMRELWHTGWMHNRARMITASFLVKHLLIHWRHGEEWFWDTLVDADVANNAANWQWVAGCGADAAPYIRVFNPVLQGKKFDPQGEYVRRWVPELAGMPNRHIHSPWEGSPLLRQDYPPPMVDHAAARGRALEAFASYRSHKAAP